MSASPLATPHCAQALKELQQVYRNLEDTLKLLGPRCKTSGNCCNFRIGQYILYSSELETELVRRQIAAPDPWSLRPSGECPFLVDRLCSIHPVRPLGCRTYFCDPNYRPQEAALYEEFIRRIARISESYGIPWNYRPFHGPSARHVLRKDESPSTQPRQQVFPILTRPTTYKSIQK